MTLLIIIGVIILAVVGYIFLLYNSLITARVRVQQSWKDIDIQLKKRYDLLPDLVETAKKATALDEKILTEVARLRSEGMREDAEKQSLSERSKVENQLSSLMRDIKVQVEAYPDIKSHTELSNLMDRVSDIEEKIAYARQFYNTNVGEFNTKIQVFPGVVVASLFGFKTAEFFEAPAEEREDVKVEL